MRLIVLAAGRGSRLGRLSEGLPKALVRLPDGTSLLERNIRAMESVAPIKEMVLVCGYAASSIETALPQLRMRKPIRVLYNPFYCMSGPIVSAWMASVQMAERDFLLCNGDTAYGTRAFASLVGGRADGIALGVDRCAQRSQDDMKVWLGDAGNLARVGKDIATDMADGVSTGLLAVRGSAARAVFVGQLCGMVRDQENLSPSVPWHSILNELAARGVAIPTVDLASCDWREVDTVEDLSSPTLPSLDPARPSARRGRSHAHKARSADYTSRRNV
jgi:L-glutamine-phosphate cytidylyltransferase